MKFSHDWLAQYIDLPEAPEEIARRLTAAGLSVEHVENGPHGVVYDIDVTTNRVDAMNHLGLARELSAIFDRPLRLPTATPRESAESVAGAIRIVIEDERCPRFTARVMRGVKVGPSPPWLVERLAAIGQRSINNVVDVTNFVLWETGQPVHAYDRTTLAEATILVRGARAGEKLVTLDGKERNLAAGMLMIADPSGVIGLGGVMGGFSTEVTASTTELVIECAHFEPRAVRQTARGLAIHTDACHRFERGADPEAPAYAASRVAELVQQVAGGEVLAGSVDVCAKPLSAYEVHGTLDLTRLARFIGLEVPRATVERWLGRLGFALTPQGEHSYRVRVPSWRYYDVLALREDGDCYEADLFEEVARLVGLDAIPATVPAARGADAPPNPAVVRRHALRDLLAASGFAEAVSYAFHEPAALAAFPNVRPGTAAVELANPLSERYSVLRQSLLPGLVESALFNLRRGAAAVRLFEAGSGFFASSSDATDLPEEVELIALVCGGTVGDPWQGERELDFFAAKGAVENLLDRLGLRVTFHPVNLPGLVAGACAEIRLGERVMGYLGRLEAAETYPLFVAELELGPASAAPVPQVEAPSRFPGIAADLTLTHALDTPWSALQETVAELAPALLAGFALKDRYQGKGVPEGAVNTTITFSYQAADRSLTQEEVNQAHVSLSESLRERFGWSA